MKFPKDCPFHSPSNNFFSDQRKFTDEDFLTAFDLNYRPLSKVKAAIEKNDLAAAKKEILKHFRNRKYPRVARFRTDPHWSDWGEMTVVKRAELLAENKVATETGKIVDMGGGPTEHGGIDWEQVRKAKQVVLRQGSIGTISEAWEQTRDSKHAESFQRWIRSYVAALPFVLEDGFHKEAFAAFGGKGHEQLSSCYVTFAWASALDSGLFRTEGVLPDDFAFFFLKHFYFLAFQYNRFLGASWRADNHHLMERGVHTYFMGVQFPEFKAAKALEDYGREITLQHFEHNLLADNTGSEHCLAYQYRCFIRYALPDSVGLANGKDLLGKARRKRLSDWLEFQGWLTAPDGRQPDHGDGAGSELQEVVAESGAMYGSAISKGISESLKLKPEINPAFSDKWKKLAGRLPKETCCIYPRGGHFVLRNNWSPDSHFLWLGIKNESLYDIHTHWDIFDFMLSSYGKRLIGDPNGRTYGAKQKGSDSRGYYFSMDAHNGVVINEDILTSYRALALPRAWGRQPPRIISAATCINQGGSVDYGTFVHDGYRPILHRRDVLQVRGRYYIITDGSTRDFKGFNTVFAGEGDIRPHIYRQNLHFEVGVGVEKWKEAGSLKTTCSDGGNVLIVPEPFENLSCNIKADPYLEASDDVEFRDCKVGEIIRDTMGQCFFSTIYRPFLNSDAPDLSVVALTPKKTPFRNDEYHAIAIRDGDFQDVWFVQREQIKPKMRQIDEAGFKFETDAACLFLSFKGGKLVTAFRCGGSRVNWNGKPLKVPSYPLKVFKILPRLACH
jgi:hypothetical protein